MDILDISITTQRKKGERRKSGIGYNHNPNWETPNVFNPYPVLMNHRKHASQIYREATGGLTKQVPRLQLDNYWLSRKFWIT